MFEVNISTQQMVLIHLQIYHLIPINFDKHWMQSKLKISYPMLSVYENNYDKNIRK